MGNIFQKNKITKYENGIYNGYQKKSHNVDYKDGKDGIVKYNTSEKYTGLLYNNLYNGIGILDSNEYILSGNWLNNKLNGKGKIIYNNIIYDGELLNGIPNGIGILTTGKYIYTGEFQNNIINGYGILKDSNNNILYKGRWKRNSPIKKEFNLKLETININDISYSIPILNNKTNKVCKNCSNKIIKCQKCIIKIKK